MPGPARASVSHAAVGATGAQRAGKGDWLDLARLKTKDLEGLEVLAQPVAPIAGKGGEPGKGFEALPEGTHLIQAAWALAESGPLAK